jgi:hypothetical protein
MPVVKTILKNTHQEAVVKVAGTAAAATIDLSADLVATGQALDGEIQKASIVGVTWTGAANGVAEISRNGVVVMTLQANAAGALEMNGQMMLPDNINDDKDVTVTISGAQTECWIRLRKTSGYKTTIEPEQFGPYDDPTVAGA